MIWTVWVGIGAFLAAAAVATGAFGAHALQQRLSPDSLALWEVACRYHMYHALGLLGCGLVGTRIDSYLLHFAGLMICLGVLAFSGSLYAYVFMPLKWLMYFTPLGGACMIVGWILLGVSVIRG